MVGVSSIEHLVVTMLGSVIEAEECSDPITWSASVMSVLQSTAIEPKLLAVLPTGIPAQDKDHLIEEYADFKQGLLLVAQVSRVLELRAEWLLGMAQARAMLCSGDGAFRELILRLFCGEILAVFADHTESPAELENDKGWGRQQVHEYEQAITHHEEAIRLSPGYSLAWINKGIALKNLGRYAEAAATHCHVITDIDARYRKAWQNLGVAVACLDRLGLASVAWAKALDVSPSYPAAAQALQAAIDRDDAKVFRPAAIRKGGSLFLGDMGFMVVFDSQESLKACADGLQKAFSAAGLIVALQSPEEGATSQPEPRTNEAIDVVIVEPDEAENAMRSVESAGYEVVRVGPQSTSQETIAILLAAKCLILIHGAAGMACVAKYWELLVQAHRRKTPLVFLPVSSALVASTILDTLKKEGKAPSRRKQSGTL
jgi:tetratricopeptide (TPR) repeat protein